MLMFIFTLICACLCFFILMLLIFLYFKCYNIIKYYYEEVHKKQLEYIDELNNSLSVHQELIKVKDELINFFQKEVEYKDQQLINLINEYVLSTIGYMIDKLIVYKMTNEQEPFSYLYNKLYFFGVNKDILDDNDKLIDFMNKCFNREIIVEEGVKPFAYKFIIKE